jgi:hypothetical protein
MDPDLSYFEIGDAVQFVFLNYMTEYIAQLLEWILSFEPKVAPLVGDFLEIFPYA